MWYWIVLALLCAVALGLIIAIFLVMKKNQSSGNDMDDYEDEQPRQSRQARRTRREEDEDTKPDMVQREVPRQKAKRQWKLVLENLDTWEKYEYIFYDNIGIGRSRSSGEFEKFLPVPDDARVSKIHCVIIRKGERLYLKDLGSRNGTFLNGKRLTQPLVLQRDDVIGVGETKIEIKKVLRERD